MAKDPLITRKTYRKYKQKNEQAEKRSSWQNKLFGSLKPAVVEEQSLEERVAAKKAELNGSSAALTQANNESKPELSAHQQPEAADRDTAAPVMELDSAETRIFNAARITEMGNERAGLDVKSKSELSQDKPQAAATLPAEAPAKKRFHWHHKKASDQALEAATPADQNKPTRQPIDKFLNIGIAVCALGIIIVSSIALFV